MREFALLERFCQASTPTDAVVVGPGDDAAVLALRAGHTAADGLLVSVDQLIEGIHFQRAPDNLPAIGQKAVARALSDIAAMGGAPIACVCAVTLPPDLRESSVEILFHAVRDAASRFGAPLVGGDMAVSTSANVPLSLTVTVLGHAVEPGAVLRDGARPGDGLFVTGLLGRTLDADGGGHHLTFTPRLTEGRMLRGLLGARLHAMIDLSDGLGRDAGHIARASGVALDIDTNALPRRGTATWREAVCDGEDYELLFCAEGDVPTELAGCPVTRIGTVVERTAAPLVRLREGTVVHAGETMGWEHHNGCSEECTSGESS